MASPEAVTRPWLSRSPDRCLSKRCLCCAFSSSPRRPCPMAAVAMGAVFAGIIRAPMTSVLIVFEMTGSYGLVLPLMIANMSAYGLARHWRPLPIYEALLLQDGVVLPHKKPVTPDDDVAFSSEVPP